MRTKIIIVSIFIGGFSVLAQAASFQCTMNSSELEKLICNDANVSSLDEKLTSTYVEAKKNAIDRNALKVQQLNWVKEKRNACVNVACLMKVYQARLEEFTNLVAHPIDGKYTQTSSSVSGGASTSLKKQPYKIVEGDKYEVCRVFNNYLNSEYYQPGDCFIKKYPNDKRLESPNFTEVDVVQYEEQEIAAKINTADKWEKMNIPKRIKRANSGNERSAWKTQVDINHDGVNEDVLYISSIKSTEPGQPNKCAYLGGELNLLINENIDFKTWNGQISGVPFLFDGKIFLGDGDLVGEGSYTIIEPDQLKPNEYRNGFDRQGNLKLSPVCNFKN